MDRVRDYANFMLWFAGLGYLVLRPLIDSSQPLAPGLHVVGMAAAGFVAVRLLLIAFRRTLGRESATVSDGGASAASPLATRRPTRPPQSKIKPRAQFGLRSGPR